MEQPIKLSYANEKHVLTYDRLMPTFLMALANTDKPYNTRN